MPFTARSFKARHNKKLGASGARKASKIANAMLKRGVPEGESIATANARAEGKPRRGAANSPLSARPKSSATPRSPKAERL